MTNDYSGFSLILDSLNVSAQLPFQIISEHWFRKAEPQEVNRIKEQLSIHPYATTKYEYSYSELGDGRKEGHPMPMDKWRYYVISFAPDNYKLNDIDKAVNLLKNDINLGYTFHTTGISYNMSHISTFFDDQHNNIGVSKQITDDDLNQITKNYDLITKLEETLYPNISKAIEDFYQTKSITNKSTLKVLAYFSIIECLLTHPPIPTDTIGSITHQIASKMCLLSKRFQRELIYTSFFTNDIKPENLWKKLYSFRSLLAHGGIIDFHQKNSSLVSIDNIRLFLTDVLKLLLIYALEDPEFITDLQKC